MMRRRNLTLNEETIHRLFRISLWGKGIFAFLEILGGIGTFFVTQTFLIKVVLSLTQGEFAESPHDPVAIFLLHAVEQFPVSVNAQHFAAIYLIVHGIIQIWLVRGLFLEKIWYYPIALTTLLGFIVYQIYQYTLTHSLWLFVLIVFDIVVLLLSWHEYQFMRYMIARKKRR